MCKSDSPDQADLLFRDADAEDLKREQINDLFKRHQSKLVPANPTAGCGFVVTLRRNR